MKTTQYYLSLIKNNIIEQSVFYIKEHPNIQSLVIGVSGGADSALVSLLARDVCYIAKNAKIDIKLIGRLLIMPGNKPDEVQRACDLGNIIFDDFKPLDLTKAYYQLIDNIEIGNQSKDSFENKIRMGNIKARIRMIQLYHLAHLNKGIVLSTDNLSEYMLGFWTIHGDVGDFGMIQNLWKTEVYSLLKNYAAEFLEHSKEKLLIQDIINAVPTDGLGITKSDLDQFGDIKSYKELDLILEEYSKNGAAKFLKNKGVLPKCLVMYETTHYKRNNPYNIPRERLMEVTI